MDSYPATIGLVLNEQYLFNLNPPYDLADFINRLQTAFGEPIVTVLIYIEA